MRRNMRGVRGVLILCVGTACAVSSADAEVITFTYTGRGSGSIGQVNFTSRLFTLSAIGDTANRVRIGNAWRISHGTASVSIDGIGTYAIGQPTSSAVNNTYQAVIFGDPVANDALYVERPHPAFETWDLSSSIGPFTLSGEIWDTPLTTSGGTLSFLHGFSAGTYQAVVVPAPGAVLVGTLSVWGRAVRRRR